MENKTPEEILSQMIALLGLLNDSDKKRIMATLNAFTNFNAPPAGKPPAVYTQRPRPTTYK
jgi:hypothetical protein